MAHKYIRNNKNSYNVVKSSKLYSKTENLDDALFIRDLLVENDWNLDKIPQTVTHGGTYLVLAGIDEKLHLLKKSDVKPSQSEIERLIKRKIRNPNNSRYGLNISRIFDVFVIKKTIFGDDYVFGYYDNLEDAEFVRNFLLDHDWNVAAFGPVEFDDETDSYKAVSVIDDKVYVLDTSESDDIDLNRVYEEFLSKIIKHKHGLSNYPHLDHLTDKIGELEAKFNVTAQDENWDLNRLDSSPLEGLLFTLTPFQKSVYDAVDVSTSFEEIKKALIRYRSGNFENKIRKNLDELIKLNLIEKTDDGYDKL